MNKPNRRPVRALKGGRPRSTAPKFDLGTPEQVMRKAALLGLDGLLVIADTDSLTQWAECHGVSIDDANQASAAARSAYLALAHLTEHPLAVMHARGLITADHLVAARRFQWVYARTVGKPFASPKQYDRMIAELGYGDANLDDRTQASIERDFHDCCAALRDCGWRTERMVIEATVYMKLPPALLRGIENPTGMPTRKGGVIGALRTALGELDRVFNTPTARRHLPYG